MGMRVCLKVNSGAANFLFYKMPIIVKYHKQNQDTVYSMYNVSFYSCKIKMKHSMCLLGGFSDLF